MNFLLRTSDSFIVIDHRPRQGVFYQPYTRDGFTKANLIHAFPSDSFYALLDKENHLHLITESQKNQILYIHFERGIPQKTVVLEDPNHYYFFKHFHLQLWQDKLYLFYSVKHPTGNSRSFMYQPLDPSGLTIDTLIPSLPDNTIVKILAERDTLYIVYTDFDHEYSLKVVTLSPTGVSTTTLFSSTLPIIDFNCCLRDSTLHVTYIKDAYGKQQVGYINSLMGSEILLDIPRLAQAPCIFIHAGYLWITYPYGDKLYMLLSVDNGMQFSASVASSLSGPFTTFACASLNAYGLNTTALHATVSLPLRIGVISAIDLNGLHPDLTPSAELELLLEGIRLSSPTHTPPVLSPPPSPMPSPLVQPTDTGILSALPLEPEPLKRAPSDLKSATRNFMGNLAAFDATPK